MCNIKLKAKIEGIIFVVFLVLFSHQVSGQKPKTSLRDSTDNAIDLSNFLNSVTGFLPVPSLITEPAVGYGGVLGILYFHKKKKNFEKSKYGLLPPVMSVAAGGATSNGTYFGMLGHIGSYKKDRFRYVGALGLTHINLSFYGAGIIQDEREYRFNMKGWFIFQEFMMRINKDIPFFIGANYVYFDNTLKFKLDIDLPIFDDLEKGTKTAGINSVFLWDSRDNTFTPNRGIMAALELGIFDKSLGGDNAYNNFNFRTYAYADKWIPKTIAALRLTTQAKWGDPSFYELPFISLRGIPLMRYQNTIVSVAETEWRYNIWKRWSLVGFTGAGFAYPDFEGFKFEDAKISYGGGFRYFLAKQYGMHAGIDIAKGPEKWIWYVVIGSNWFR